MRGFGVQLVESTVGGGMEICSATCDVIELRKFGSSDATKFTVFYFQIDDMRPNARLPVVFQPTDSGWNCPMREDGRKDVPFLQVGFEREVAMIMGDEDEATVGPWSSS